MSATSATRRRMRTQRQKNTKPELLIRSRARDRDTDRRLREAGWLPVRVWEHESADVATDRIVAAVADRRYTRS